jgi:hypothetical protein
MAARKGKKPAKPPAPGSGKPAFPGAAAPFGKKAGKKPSKSGSK